MSAGPGSGAGSVTWWGHATTLVELGGERFLTDPLLRSHVGPLRWTGARPPEQLARSATAVLVSHQHRDHLDLPSLAMLPSGTPILVPESAGRLVGPHVRGDVHELAAGDEVTIGGTVVRAVVAEHDGRRGRTGGPRPALGFVLRAADGQGAAGVVYFAGDTDLHPAMSDLAADRIGLALLPVGGWGPTLGAGHLDPAGAAEALTLVRPARAVPIHWGSLRVPGAWRARPSLFTEPGRAFAAAAARVAPAVDVVVARVGEPVPVPLRGNGGAAS